MPVPSTRHSRALGVAFLSAAALVTALVGAPDRHASTPGPTTRVTLRFELPEDATPAERDALVGQEVRLHGYDPSWIHCRFGAQEEPRWRARIGADRTVAFDGLPAAHWIVSPYRDPDGPFAADADFVFVVDGTERALSVPVPLMRGRALQCGADPPR